MSNRTDEYLITPDIKCLDEIIYIWHYYFAYLVFVIRKHKQINQHHIKNINFDDIRKMSNVVEYEIINKSFENFLSKVLIVL